MPSIQRAASIRPARGQRRSSGWIGRPSSRWWRAPCRVCRQALAIPNPNAPGWSAAAAANLSLESQFLFDGSGASDVWRQQRRCSGSLLRRARRSGGGQAHQASQNRPLRRLADHCRPDYRRCPRVATGQVRRRRTGLRADRKALGLVRTSRRRRVGNRLEYPDSGRLDARR